MPDGLSQPFVVLVAPPVRAALDVVLSDVLPAGVDVVVPAGTTGAWRVNCPSGWMVAAAAPKSDVDSWLMNEAEAPPVSTDGCPTLDNTSDVKCPAVSAPVLLKVTVRIPERSRDPLVEKFW